MMTSEIEILEVEKKIRSRVKKQMEKSQKEYYLNEQMQAIQKELGEKDDYQAELMELKANPDRPATGIVLEARLEKGRGPIGTVLVQEGTLRKGDALVSSIYHGRVRMMLNRAKTTPRITNAARIKFKAVVVVSDFISSKNLANQTGKSTAIFAADDQEASFSSPFKQFPETCSTSGRKAILHIAAIKIT